MSWPLEPDGRVRHRLARRVHGHLDVLYVPEDCWHRIIGGRAAACPTGAVPDCIDELSHRMATTLADQLAGTDLTLSYHTIGSGIASALARRADSVGADTIIIGRSRRRRSHPLRASITHRMFGCTDRIVIVVP